MRFLLACCFFFISLCLAKPAQDLVVFPEQQQLIQYTQLTQQLRCLVCQNQTLADSNAPLAKDLRDEIAQMVLQGESDQDIVNYLVNRYGNFVRYQPPLISSTIILWFAPLLVFIMGLMITGFIIWQRHKRMGHLS
jgi:cytochrome c-type biogenesis protein CcmH